MSEEAEVSLMPNNPFIEDSLAQRYEQWYEIGEGRRTDLLEKQLLGQLLDGFFCVQSLLEIGCGTGHFTRYFATFFPSVVGLDISPAMLEEGRRRNTDKGIPYLVGDALHLPFSDASFDVVAFITTLEFLNNPQQALREAGRVARRGLLLGVLNAYSLMGIARRLEGLKKRTIYNYAHFYSVGELSRLVRKSLSDRKNKLFWRTTLFPKLAPLIFPKLAPLKGVALPFGGFIGMRVLFREMIPRGLRSKPVLRFN
jgi:ubiquinone/menaquinone biosynthesis C-methylase UbiE